MLPEEQDKRFLEEEIEDSTALVIEVKKFKLSKQTITDLITYFWIAGVGFTVNVGSRVVYSDRLEMNFNLAMVLAYLTGMVVAFVLSKLFAFDSRKSGRTTREAIKFVIVSFFAMAVTMTIANLALLFNEAVIVKNPNLHETVVNVLQPYGYTFINRELASHLAGMSVGFFVNFIGHKLITFKSTGVWAKYNAIRGTSAS